MELNDTALKTVRAALLEFRSASRVNGHKRSWFNIANDMHRGFLEDDEAKTSDPRKGLSEALRRFAAATQVPTPDRLEVLCQYLIERKFLSKADVDVAGAEPALVTALQDYFAVGSEPAQSGPPLSATFVARRKSGTRTELSFLTIGEERAGTFTVTERLYSLCQSRRFRQRAMPSRVS